MLGLGVIALASEVPPEDCLMNGHDSFEWGRHYTMLLVRGMSSMSNLPVIDLTVSAS